MVKVVISDNKGLVQEAGTNVVLENSIAVGGDLELRGRQTQKFTHADADTQNHTLTVAQIKDGLLVHTSTTGAGTLTTPTAAAIIAGDSGVGALEQNGDSIIMYYMNDGNQTVTVTAGSNVTVLGDADVPTNTGATLIFRRHSSTAVRCFVV
tara:strand:- start:354 stop:809 length:456 start_codon:yes stop_codon:yes gene_type:complete